MSRRHCRLRGASLQCRTSIRRRPMNKVDIVGKLLDLIKWAVPALGGLALFKWLAERWEKRDDLKLLREQIYGEMADNYDAVLYRLTEVTSYEGLKHGSIERFHDHLDLSFSIYNQHTTNNREVFFKMREAKAVESIYGGYTVLSNETEASRVIPAARKAAALFDKAVRRRQLDLDMLKKVAPAAVWSHVQRLLDGERASHEARSRPSLA